MNRVFSFLPAVGVGLLLGSLLPVVESQHSIATTAPHESPARHTPEPVIEMPAENRTAWAAGFGASHAQEFCQWLLKQDPQPDSEIVHVFFHAWIQHDPDAAFTAALRMPARFGFAPMTENSAGEPVAYSGVFIMEVKDLLDSNPAAAFRWVGRVEGVLGAFGVNNFNVPFENHPDLKPEEVAKCLNQSLPGQFTETMVNSYARFLLEKHGLDACLTWMKTLNPEHQNATLEAVCLEWGKTDPKGVMEYLQGASSSIRQYRALYLLTPTPGDSITQTIDWLDQNMGVTSFTGLCNLLAGFDRSDPEGAQKYVMALEDPGQRLDAVAGLAESHTMRSSVPETMQWIATLPPDMQVEATAGAMRWRLDSDYVSFMAPISDGSLAPEIQDRYIQQLAGQLAEGMMWDSKGAIRQWLEANPGDARDAFVRAGTSALEKKPEYRTKFLSCLPPAEVERILGPQH